MAARKSQFVFGTLGCLAAGTLDIVGLSTCHWASFSNTTIGLWTCCHNNKNNKNIFYVNNDDDKDDEMDVAERSAICNKLSWNSLPMNIFIVRILALLTMVFFLISLLGMMRGWLWEQSQNTSTGFLLARIQEIGTMIGSLLVLLLVAIYVTNYQDFIGPDYEVSLGYSFILCVTGLGVGIVAAINLCCARGYRDYQRVQKKNLHESPFTDY